MLRTVALLLAVLLASGCTNFAEETRWLPREPLVVYDASREVAADQPRWVEVRACPARGELAYEASTRLLEFTDDVEIGIASEGPGTRLRIRSASRVGKHDFGANATRVRVFLDALARRLAANPAGS